MFPSLAASLFGNLPRRRGAPPDPYGEFLANPPEVQPPAGLAELLARPAGRMTSESVPAEMSYRDALAAVQPTRAITFSGPRGGVETANYDADGRFINGDFRGIGYAGLNDRENAVAKFAREQGQRETGIAGMPSVESLMSSQLFGTNMSPDEKRMIAVGLQQKLLNPVTALESHRIQGTADVERAKLMQKDAVNNKVMEAALFNAQRIREGGGTEAQARDAFEGTMRQAGVALPETIRDRLAATPVLGPKDVARSQIMDDISKIVSRGELNRGSASTLLDRLGSLPADQQKTAIENLLMTRRAPEAGGTMDDLRDELFRSAAYDVLLTDPSGFTNKRSGERLIPGAGLPFDLIAGGGLSQPGQIVTRKNRNIPLDWSQRPSIFTRMKVTPQERQAALARLAAAPALLEALLGQ